MCYAPPSSEFYEEDALMMSEGMDLISGLLMGLSIIDYTVMMTGEEFDRTVSTLTYIHSGFIVSTAGGCLAAWSC